MSLGLKILLTPVLIAAASLAGRRWGTTISGWLVGLPFTTGPVVFFLALDHGNQFAAAAATGTLAAAISEVAFCTTYAFCAFRLKWPLSLLAAVLAFAVSTFLLRFLHLPPVPLYLLAGAFLALGLYIMTVVLSPFRRSPSHQVEEAVIYPSWDLPARMVIATVFVVLLTGIAPLLGPQLAGLLAPFPLYASILVTFAHQQRGPAAAGGVLRGLLLGLFAFATCFFVLALVLPVAGIGVSFALAILAMLTVQAGSLFLLTRPSRLAFRGGDKSSSGPPVLADR
jgi:hypothetical protein